MLFIRRVIQQYPEIYEDEIQEWIQFALGKTIHVSTIAKLLKKMGFTRRKVHIECLSFEKEEKQFITSLISTADYEARTICRIRHLSVARGGINTSIYGMTCMIDGNFGNVSAGVSI